MASTLNIIKSLTSDNQWQITATVNSGGTLPLDIFIYTNLGTNTLGQYIGVCNVDEYQRLQTFTGTVLPIFGNRFIKSTSAKIILSTLDDPLLVITHLQNSVQALSTALKSLIPVTQLISIL